MKGKSRFWTDFFIKKLTDSVAVLDDASTDETVDVIRKNVNDESFHIEALIRKKTWCV